MEWILRTSDVPKSARDIFLLTPAAKRGKVKVMWVKQ